MIAGFVAHTIWIGTICARTGHPPITNLPETASFMAWTIFAVELVLYVRYRVYAAVFFVYPLVLLLLTLSAVAGENFRVLDPELRSNVFTTHLLLSTVGVAGLIFGAEAGSQAACQQAAGGPRGRPSTARAPRVMPCSGLSVSPLWPNSGVVVLPISTAPCSRSRGWPASVSALVTVSRSLRPS